MKKIVKKMLPNELWNLLSNFRRKLSFRARMALEKCGFKIARVSDYYSPLPTESEIKRNVDRWNKPSTLTGVEYNIEEYKALLQELITNYGNEFKQLPKYDENQALGFGPGYTEIDALVLYMMIRELKPKRYFEVGSGLSTYYCHLASKENAKEDNPLNIKCVEPYPYDKLYSLPKTEVIKEEVQDTEKTVFEELEENDILFIDSSHVLEIDGDVPYLYLEVLPALKKGVVVHIHDIPFPYNTPYPAEQWVLGEQWPMYWNEAMVLQAFLAFNESYKILMSTPLLRHYDEDFLKKNVPLYKSIEDESNTFSSIWLRKVK